MFRILSPLVLFTMLSAGLTIAHNTAPPEDMRDTIPGLCIITAMLEVLMSSSIAYTLTLLGSAAKIYHQGERLLHHLKVVSVEPLIGLRTMYRFAAVRVCIASRLGKEALIEPRVQ